MMETLASVFSSLFRLCAYVFLRVIPTSLAKFILPALYSLYLACFCLSTPKAQVKRDSNDEKRDSEPVSTPADTFSRRFFALVFTLPTPVYRIRAASLTINTLLFLASIDLAAEPYYHSAPDVTFTRVGAVYPDGAKIAVRYPRIEEPIHVTWRQSRHGGPDLPWHNGPILNLTEENDWVDTVSLKKLWPSTNYEYMLKAENGSFLSYPPSPVPFKTFPDPRLNYGSNFRFLVSSCIKPNFPYAPLRGNRIKGFDLLADYLWPKAQPAIPDPVELEHQEVDTNSTIDLATQTSNDTVLEVLPKPSVPAEFLLFLGDFVYADVPYYFGDDKEAYRRLYRRNYDSPSFRKVYERLPIVHAYDDHEIINNYAGQSTDGSPFVNATDPFKIYNARGNYDSVDEDEHYYEFNYGTDASFFVMDTRRHRSQPAEVEVLERTMLGEKQLAAFYQWLTKTNSTVTFKFVVSSVPFTSLWTHDAQIDSWAAYETEKSAILQALATVPNVVILSGDRHEFAAIEFTPELESQHKVLEFSTSPLSMFYIPFVRTLKQASEETVTRIYPRNDASGGLEDEEVVEEIPKERVIKYLPIGNYKWASVEVDTRDPAEPITRIEIVIDGQVHYTHVINGTPVVRRSATAAIGNLIPDLKGVFDKIGLKPSKWF